MGDLSVDDVVRLWEELTGFPLSPRHREEFRRRAEAIELARYSERVLRRTARRILERDPLGELRLAAWAESVRVDPRQADVVRSEAARALKRSKAEARAARERAWSRYVRAVGQSTYVASPSWHPAPTRGIAKKDMG